MNLKSLFLALLLIVATPALAEYPQGPSSLPNPGFGQPGGYAQPGLGYGQPQMGYGQPGGSYGQPGVGYGQSPMGYGQPGMGYGPMGYGGHGQNFASGGCGQPMPRPTCGARRRKYRSHYRGQGCGQQGGYGSFSLALSFGFGGSMI